MDKQQLYQAVREAVELNPAEAPEIILRAMTDGQREAYDALARRASHLEFAWMAGLAYAGKVSRGTKSFIARSIINILQAQPNLAPVEQDMLERLTQEVHGDKRLLDE